MKHNFRYMYLNLVAAVSVGFMSASAQALPSQENNFSNIARNITDSVAELPGLVTALSYLFGILLGVLGVMKVKDHVENPSQTPLKDGAIRLAAGGALFALPIIFEAMLNTIGTTGVNVEAPTITKAGFNVS